jgi:hypothetical protein
VIKLLNPKHKPVLKKSDNPRLSRGFFRFSSLFAVSLIISGIIISSCTKEFDSIGMELIDDQLDITSDTILPLSAFTEIEDSVPSSLAEQQLLGFFRDDIFGKTKASIYTEPLPLSIPFNIPGTRDPDSLFVDSVVLSIAYSGYFGDLSTQQSISIFELEDTIPAGTVYSNKSLGFNPDPLHFSQFLPQPNDSVYVIGPDGDTTDILPPHIRLNLPESLGRRFIDSFEETSEFTSYDEYRGFFKGLYITVDETPGPGSILYFNLRSTLSRMEIHYHYISGEDTTVTSYILPLYDQFSRRFSHFDNFGYQDASPEIKQQALEGDTVAGMERVFIQSMANFRSKIWLPDPEDILDNSTGQIAINSAKIIVPVDSLYLQDEFGYASRLILLRGDEEEGDLVNLDDLALGTAYFGGELNEEETHYSFNITQHLQRVISGDLPNYPLYLRTSNSFQNAERVVINGPGREENPLRLEIKYTQPVSNK